MKKIIALLIVISAVIFNLWLYRAETTILADPNDNVFQYALVHRTNWIWENYGCPINPACLPNLIDHNVTYWAEGYSLPFYYSHLPQIAIVTTHKLIIAPLSSFARQSLGVGGTVSLFQYYSFTKYLLLSLFPLPVFIAFLLLGFPAVPSALAAFFAAHYSTDGLYGIDPPSFLWRGYGLTSQLYAMFFMPLTLAFIWRTLKKMSPKNFLFAVLFLVLTTAGHLGIGIITLLASFPLIFTDLNKKNLLARFKTLTLVIASMIFLLSYWILPILFNNNYHIVSFWDPIWKFDSYGWYEVIRQYWAGEIFDWQRAPLITGMVTVGLFILLLSSNLSPFALSFILMLLLYFGRTTWGPLLDLIPGMKDFHQHRFIAGVHLTSLFLLPPFFERLIDYSRKIAGFVNEKLSAVKDLEIKNVTSILTPLIYLPLIAVLTYFTAIQTVKYNSLNHRWIAEANTAFRYSEKDFYSLLENLDNNPKGRIYAGRPGNWGKDFRLGSTQIYMMLSVLGYDLTQWLPETWSMMSENDQNFDERASADYDLLNTRYIISPPENKDFPANAKLISKSGPYQLHQVPTSGWFDVVESPMAVISDKTNFLNIVYLWHRSYPRTWKMHPLISVEKNPDFPKGMQRTLKMTDEVNYKEGVEIKNIFSDYPFVFPVATVSGTIKQENVNRQTYSAQIEVPANCKNCMYMFKMSYHPNWQFKVDGKIVDKYAVFPMYVAARASPGTHTVEVTHKPNSLKVFLLFLEIITIPLIFIYRKKLIRYFNLKVS